MACFSRLPGEPGFRGIRQPSRKNGTPGATGNSEGEANPLRIRQRSDGNPPASGREADDRERPLSIRTGSAR